MNFRSYNHFLEFPMINRGLLPGWSTRGALAERPGGSSGGDSRAARRHPGGLRLGTRGATGGIRGKLSHADLAAHSGLVGGIRDSPRVSLGTRGDSEGSRGSLLFRHSERVASSGGFRRAYSDGWDRVVRLEINGRDSSFRSDRLNCSERRWPSDSKWAAKIDSLDQAEAK